MLGGLAARAARVAGLGEKASKVYTAIVTNMPNAVLQSAAGFEQSISSFMAQNADNPDALVRGYEAARQAAKGSGVANYLLEMVPVSFATRQIKAARGAAAVALATGTRAQARAAMGRFLGKNAGAVLASEVVQEVSTGAAQELIDATLEQVVSYEAEHGSLDGFEMDWDEVSRRVGASVPVNFAAALGLAGITQGASAAVVGMSAEARLNDRIEGERLNREASRLAKVIVASREADGVHIPAWESAVETEVNGAVKAKEEKLGRELTDEERVDLERETREQIAIDDLHQLYNQWVTEKDEKRKHDLLANMGLSENQITEFVRLFEDIKGYRGGQQIASSIALNAASLRDAFESVGVTGVAFTDLEVENDSDHAVEIDWGNGRKTRIVMTQGTVDEKNAKADGVFIHRTDGKTTDATGAIVDVIRVASSSGMGSTHLIGHEMGHNLMSIARDAGVISDAQQKEIDELFTGKDGKFDEEAFAEAFARELKRAFHETVQKRMEDVPTTKAGWALRRVADFIVTLGRFPQTGAHGGGRGDAAGQPRTGGSRGKPAGDGEGTRQRPHAGRRGRGRHGGGLPHGGHGLRKRDYLYPVQ